MRRSGPSRAATSEWRRRGNATRSGRSCSVDAVDGRYRPRLVLGTILLVVPVWAVVLMVVSILGFDRGPVVGGWVWGVLVALLAASTMFGTMTWAGRGVVTRSAGLGVLLAAAVALLSLLCSLAVFLVSALTM